ncbi:probable alpha-glucosidase 2 [Ustilago trichophora]|uniref:Probable alpha-glucosidase 2 n=1 Tax=Ustilago trichophora TaxID=86804 RepID=A0A5C3EIL6_9BASI|nr:probable alpha-glucosidase 2 [Ustilago trichophora]
MIESKEQAIEYRYDGELLRIEAWGPNALRIRSTRMASLSDQDWGIYSKPQAPSVDIRQQTHQLAGKKTTTWHLNNGHIEASLSSSGKLTIFNKRTARVLLEEYSRNRQDPCDPNCSALLIDARDFVPIIGGDYQLIARFQTQDPDEKIYGMGQYQQPFLNLMGVDLELAQRNSQASVPFFQSSRGYGFLWNNPAVGRAVFGKNVITFESRCTKVLDYWIVAGDAPADIQRAYAEVVGKPPMMPEWGLGFIQCKLRYETQEQLLSVARRHKALGLPLDVMVCDFFHWPKQGDWMFDPLYWPEPKAMIEELKEMGVELMVSIWPTMEKRSRNYEAFKEQGHLIRTERGARTAFDFLADCSIVDFTNPAAREHVWSIAKKSYFDLGIRMFWLDEAEPEYLKYDFDHFRYHEGPLLTVGNEYPRAYARCFHEGQTADGQKQVVNLLRCAWIGSQRYGALLWSGDVASSWSSMKNQLAAGLSVSIAGIPWWNSDIGGFHGGDPNDPAFRELLIRWFQWGAFCPVMRLHGDREPRQPKPDIAKDDPDYCQSGADNEVWSYGEEAFLILKKYILVREALREYTRSILKNASDKGDPVMRTLFYEFPADQAAWKVEDEYMYGHKYLVCPILKPDARKRRVYLPADAKWARISFDGTLRRNSEELEGGSTILVEAPIDDMPVFERI